MTKPTIYTLAEELGVHPATVSRAFSRPEMVREGLRNEILALAAKRGFRHNLAARQLVTGRSGLLGLLVPDVENLYFTSLFHHLSRLGGELGFSVVVTDWRFVEDDQADLFERVLGVVDALVVAAPRDDVMTHLTDHLETLPLVFVNRMIPDASCIIVDNHDALWSLGDRMLELGHTHVAAVAGPQDSWAAGRRIDDLTAWAESTGTRFSVVGSAEPSTAGGESMAQAVIDSGATAVFCFDDLMAAGLMKGLSDRGRAVPSSISVVGCDDALIAGVTSPGLTTIRAPYEDLATQVMATVQGLLTNSGARRVRTMAGVPVRRESLAAAPH